MKYLFAQIETLKSSVLITTKLKNKQLTQVKQTFMDNKEATGLMPADNTQLVLFLSRDILITFSSFKLLHQEPYTKFLTFCISDKINYFRKQLMKIITLYFKEHFVAHI